MSASFLFEMALKGSVVVLVALATARALSVRASAALRHVVWVIALAALVVLPAMMMLAPKWRVSLVPGSWATRAEAVLRLSARASRTLGSVDVFPSMGVASHAPIDASSAPAQESGSRHGAVTASSNGSMLAPTWLTALVSLWAIGALTMLLRLVVGVLWARWLVRSAMPLDEPGWRSLRDDAVARIGVLHRVQLCSSTRVGVPAACGILRPSILLPPQAESWDEPRRRIVLLHELAHVKRRDCLTQVLAQTAKALHWFNPLVLLAVARLYREQERACDDVVLKAGAAASDYADHLCEIVRTARVGAAPSWAILALARRSRLHDRVLAILDERISRRVPSWRFSLVLAVVVCVALVPVSAIQPSESIEAMALLPSVTLSRMEEPALLADFGRPMSLPSFEPAVAHIVKGAVDDAVSSSRSRHIVPMSDPQSREFVATYCSSCHNDQQKAAGVSLAAFHAATSPDRPELGEKIVRRLRAGVHPPQSSARPSPELTEAFSLSIEDAIDQADRAGWGADVAAPLSDRELADRLATFLWNAAPDRALLQAADRETLRDGPELERQVARMLADARSTPMLAAFFGQWLHLDTLQKVTRDTREFDEDLRDAFRQELDLFVASQVREDRSAVELLTANYSFVNERLARHYGIANVSGAQFRRVTLADSARFGLLGKAGVLAITAAPNRTSPVIRGKFVLETLLGVAPPAPPPNVPALKALAPGAPPMSMRQRLEVHHSNPVCASCHRQLDALGFALENFDEVGAWRTIDGTTIDASGQLADGTTFDGPSGLRRVLVDRRELFVGALTLRLLGYALGRPPQYADMPAVRAVLSETAPTGYRWSSLIASLVRSRPFQTRPRSS